jgi:murein DD-endopeptidase MepM/ murein hydrolase activator NlpD
MKKPAYIFYGVVFIVLLIFTVFNINRNIIKNQKSITEYFLDIDPEVVTPDEPENSELVPYADSSDLYTLQNTQTVRRMLEAMRVSSLDILAIEKLINVDTTTIDRGANIRMTYIDDIDDLTKVTVFPPYISEKELVRNIKYLSFPIGGIRYIFKKEAGLMALEKKSVTITQKAVFAQGIIQSSLYDSFISQKIPYDVFQTFINIYSYDIDFQRDIRSGDSFEIVYDANITDENEFDSVGKVLYMKLFLKKHGKTFEYFILNRSGKSKLYFDRKGAAAVKTFLKTPVNGARVSSRFGYRKHPILGYSKLHTGVDFAAPSGTAIYAAADGVITFMDWNGGQHVGYGRYTIIKHNNTYSTAYAHQSKFHAGLRKGSYVRQGQVIGYVGSTGYSTGAHLHYEVMKYGQKVNPSKLLSLSSASISSKDKTQLNANITMIDSLIKEEKEKVQNNKSRI